MESARAFEYFGAERLASTPSSVAPISPPSASASASDHQGDPARRRDEASNIHESAARDPALLSEESGPAADPVRLHRLQALVAKRRSNFAYIKKMHSGEGYWLNSVRMHRSDINDFLVSNDAPWQRLMPYVQLGVSLADVCDAAADVTPHAPNVTAGGGSIADGGGAGLRALRAALQLLEEWEYQTASSFSVQSVKFMMARNVSSAFPEPDTDLGRYTLNKFNNEILFERLRTPLTPFDLDYVEVLHSLCDVLSNLYERIGSDDSCR
jgi:hypothetical protein